MSFDQLTVNPENTKPSLDVEELQGYLPETETSKQEKLEARCDKALEQLDFEYTPELQESLREYYGDHYGMAEELEALLDGEACDPSEVQSLIEQSIFTPGEFSRLYGNMLIHGNMPPAITTIIRPFLAKLRQDRAEAPDDQRLEVLELMLAARAAEALFAEPSVAVASVDEEERKLVTDISDKLLRRITESGYFDASGGSVAIKDFRQSINMFSLQNPEAAIDRAQKVFWDDCRYAGQLLFHNSGDMPWTRSQAMLMPRRMQQQINGEIHFGTAEQVQYGLHSPTVHWSEIYSPDEYKGPHPEDGGTIAMPLWKIIQSAPYARDAHYGTLRVKPERLESFKEKVRLIAQTGTIGTGPVDGQGHIGIDRTFYSSPHDVSPDAPLEGAPDGHVFKLDRSDYAVAANAQEMATIAESGIGEGFPTPILLDAPEIPDGDKWSAMSHQQRTELLERRKDGISRGIEELQARSVASQPDTFIVALRSGIFDFDVIDDGHKEWRKNAQFVRKP